MQQIVLASNNKGKIKEFQEIFNQFNIKIIPQEELNVPEIDEPYSTFIENSLHKARHCSKFTNLPAIADDSGLCVNSLAGAPGIYSARYSGEPKSEQRNIDKLLLNLNEVTDRSAFFYCSLVLIRNYNDPQPIVADGTFSGKISHQQKGHNGHGYDPIFFVPEYNCTVAELDNSLKNKISHRGLAIQELIGKLLKLNLI